MNGETDAVYIVYSQFRSALSQVPTPEKLLPVALAETSEAEAEQLTEYLYEPGIEQLLEAWQANEQESARRNGVVQRIDELRAKLLATYGQMADSTADLRNDRAR